MKEVVLAIAATVAAALGLILIWMGLATMWLTFSQIIDGSDKEGTNIYYMPLTILAIGNGVALLVPIYRLIRRGVR